MNEWNAKTIVGILGATSAEYHDKNLVFPKHMIAYETDTLNVKIGDGVSPWDELPYINQNDLSNEQLDTIKQYNQANGFVQLDSNGEVRPEHLPKQLFEHIKYVSDLEARDSIPEEERTCLVAVVSPSIADAANITVTDIYNTTQQTEAVYEIIKTEIPNGTAPYHFYPTLGRLDNFLVIAGGYTEQTTSRVDIYDTITGQWTVGQSLPIAIKQSAYCTHDGEFYVLGGENSSNSRIKNCYKYDFNNDQWTQIADLPIALAEASAVSHGGKIYLHGGRDSGNVIHDGLFVYDPITDTWDTLENSSLAVIRSSLVAHDRSLYALAGYNTVYQDNITNTVRQYDIDTDTWQDAPFSLTEPKENGAAIIVEDDLIYFGGTGNNGQITDIRKINLLSLNDEIIHSGFDRNNFGYTYQDNELYTYGGSNDYENEPHLLKYTGFVVQPVRSGDIAFIEFGEPISETKGTSTPEENVTEDAYAVYVWEPTLRQWLTIYRGDNLGVDFEVFLNKNNDTMDDIKDGLLFARMSFTEKQRIENAVQKIDTFITKQVATEELV